mmetsp:Transcript_99972/g.177934  ORF Transcript_99972/g.177934 Transcript_99972/m.177934 type:complete len:120 (-) Transcript_99972:52-411(-)
MEALFRRQPPPPWPPTRSTMPQLVAAKVEERTARRQLEAKELRAKELGEREAKTLDKTARSQTANVKKERREIKAPVPRALAKENEGTLKARRTEMAQVKAKPRAKPKVKVEVEGNKIE